MWHQQTSQLPPFNGLTSRYMVLGEYNNASMWEKYMVIHSSAMLHFMPNLCQTWWPWIWPWPSNNMAIYTQVSGYVLKGTSAHKRPFRASHLHLSLETCVLNFDFLQLPIHQSGRKGKEEYLYSAILAHTPLTKCSDMDHTVLPANYTMSAFPRKRSPESATLTEVADI